MTTEFTETEPVSNEPTAGDSLPTTTSIEPWLAANLMTALPPEIVFLPFPANHRFINITGENFSDLWVMGFAGTANGRAEWWCRCICGQVKKITGKALRTGGTRSCGCLVLKAIRAAQLTHGKHGTPEYVSWNSMKTRCTNPKGNNYKDYGGRGIKVCDRWLESFENFYADMGPKPGPEFTLDRFPDNNGNYEPGNCRWADRAMQSDNTRRTIWLTLSGKTQTLTAWAKERAIPHNTLYMRLRRGWSVEAALAPPR